MDFEVVSNQNNKFGRYRIMWRIQFCAIHLRSVILSLPISIFYFLCVRHHNTIYIRYCSIAWLKRKEKLTLFNMNVGIDIDSLEVLCSRYGRYLLLVDGTFYIHSYEIYCCSIRFPNLKNKIENAVFTYFFQ